MGFARAGVILSGVLLGCSLLLIMLGQAGLQAKCKNVNDEMIDQFNADAVKQAAASVPADQSELAANVTEAVSNATSQTFRRFFEEAAQHSSFVTCARIYSLNWWAWVLQIVEAIWLAVAATGQRWPANAPSFLLFAGTILVINTIVCTNLLSLHSYGQMAQTVWDNVAVAGFCTATAVQYLFIFFGPSYARAVSAQHGNKEAPMSGRLDF